MKSLSKILVTGGAGYIGSHTCKYLAKQGLTPVTFDNLVYGHEHAVKWGPFIKGDLHDTQLLTETLKAHKIEGVIHFAAYAYVGESVTQPEKYYRNNVAGTLSLLNAMIAANVLKIVFSSTCATYGIPEKTPIDESFPQNPINPYGQTKLIVEHILQDYAKAYGLKSVALRYFNAAGADPECEIGEDHNPETHVIPLALESALTGKEFCVNGTDYPTPDGTCLRDYIHVNDLASAHLKALQNIENLGPFEAINLGVGKAYSVKEVIQSVEAISKKKMNVKFIERRPGDPATLVANASKAKQLLDWEPQFKKLDEIIETAYNWELKKRAMK